MRLLGGTNNHVPCWAVHQYQSPNHQIPVRPLLFQMNASLIYQQFLELMGVLEQSSFVAIFLKLT